MGAACGASAPESAPFPLRAVLRWYHERMVWEPRTYRQRVDATGLVAFAVTLGETDLHVSASRDLSAETRALVATVREPLERYVATHPLFAESFVPVPVEADAPEIVRSMAAAGEAAGTGPMAAVAGAIAERVALGLAALSSAVIVENGGDLYLTGSTARRVGLLAGDSPLSGSVAIELGAGALPAAVCTSSGRVGHSVSLGVAHAATVIADDGALADAVATATGNRVHGPEDIQAALAFACGIAGVRGVVVVVGDRIGASGDVRLVPLGA